MTASPNPSPRVSEQARIDALYAEVERRFAAFEPEPWPNPRVALGLDQTQTPDDWYSRDEHPEKYVIVLQRVQAWLDAAVALLGATVEPAGAAIWPQDASSDRAVLRSPRPGTAGLKVVSTGYPGVILGFADASEPETRVPHCGCDACDDGSAEHTDAVDRFFDSIITGRRARGLGPGWNMTVTPNSATDVPNGDDDAVHGLMHALRDGTPLPVPDGCTAERPASWL